MSDFREYFNHIRAELTELENVEIGRMMSSEGITYKTKVFAFYYKDSMVFKLGKSFEPESLGLSNWAWLNPFKNKPPLKAWFVIPGEYENRWHELAHLALENIKKELG
ncbi:MAG: hypothetical protein MJA31_00470 [Clostridia bacterium]|nr:hypothetical protein [Clostridia bacterium]